MKRIYIVLIVILLAIPAIWSLFHPGFFQSDDGEWMIIRFSAFHQALRDGQFPVRFLGRLNYGYGYPVANFLYPGFMYVAEPLYLLGFGFVTTIKIIMGGSMVASAVFCFLWLSRIFKNIPAFVGAMFYLYTPYHLYDLYKRGSVGEIFALAIVPFILWQLERKSFFWTSVGIAMLILSHNTLAVIFIPVIAAYIIVKDKKGFSKSSLLFASSVFLTGFGLAAFFWIPALFELSVTKFSQTSIANIREYYAEVPLIGVSSLVLFGMAVASLIFTRLEPTKKRLSVFFFSLTFLSIFFATAYSDAAWELLPSSFVQFPYRVLSYLVLSASFLAAFCVSTYKGSKQVPVLLVLIVCLIYSARTYIQPAKFFDKGDVFYATNEDTTTVKNEYMPVWVKEEPRERRSVDSDSKKVSFSVKSAGDTNILVEKMYYPGWRAYVDGKEVQIDYSHPRGIMKIPVKETSSHATLIFKETPLRLTADIVSLLTFLFLIIVVCLKSYPARKKLS